MRAALACLLAACSAPPRPPAPSPHATSPRPGRLVATVRWTSDGVPQIRASDSASGGRWRSCTYAWSPTRSSAAAAGRLRPVRFTDADPGVLTEELSAP